MIHSWFQIFIRHLKKNPLYPIINTLGLTLGITCFILVTLFVSHETSYEKWNPDLENIYRPIRLFDNGEVWNTAPYIMVTKAQEELPEIEDALILGWDGSLLFNNEGKKLVKGMRRTTANFFDFYPYPLKYGNKEQLFVNENDLVLSDEFAFELFGDSNPVGQVVHTTYQNKAKSFTITGVYITKDYPSDVQPPILRLIKKQSEFTEGQLQWGNFNYDALFKMHPNTDIAAFIKKFDEFFDTHTAKSWSVTMEEYLKDKEHRMSLENLGDMHLYAKSLRGRGANTVFILSLLALLILVISSINFINLSISGATQRAKEVAVRKTLGTNKGKVVLQFVFEVFVQCVIALVMSFALAEILLPWFNTVMGTELSLLNPYNKWSVAFLVISVLILVSGIFPGLYLSNFNPVKVLKGNFSRSKSGNVLKKTMLVTQFGISAIFLIAAFIIKMQLSYMNNKNLGFQKDQMLMVRINNGAKTWEKIDTYKQELKKMKGVEAVGTTSRPPGLYAGNGSNSNVDYKELSHQTDMHFVGADYFPTMGIKLLEGKNFTQDKNLVDPEKTTVDSDGDTLQFNQIMVNKKLVDNFGFKDPIGKRLDYWGYHGEIIGVVDNYIAKGFDEGAYGALYMNYLENESDWGKPFYVMVKLNGEDMDGTIAGIEKFWTTAIEPEYPFKYEFLDQNFAQLFAKHKRLESLVTILSGIMIFISLLGLFAIASHSVQQRYKEVAIRKTLGASERQLVYGLIKDFIIITGISLLIAMPIALFLSNKWLEDFAYRIEMPMVPFILTPVVMIILTIAIIMAQALKALKLDLVAHLKYE